MTAVTANPEARISPLERTLFLGWERPVLATATDQLLASYAKSSAWDMRHLLIVLPSGLAARRMHELIALQAQQEHRTLYPPSIVTVGDLPEQLYVARRPFASQMVQVLCWMSVLKSAPSNQLKLVVPHPPEANASQPWLELAQLLTKLHQELASDCMNFAQVVTALGKKHVEADRWRVLDQLQQAYLKQLHQLGLWDKQTARMEALKRLECKTSSRIIVIGCADLNRSQRGFLEAVAEQAEIWIAAPERLRNHFDRWGTLDGEAWQGELIDLPDDSLFVGNSPWDQAELVAACLAELDSQYHVSQVTLGVPDSSLIPELQHQLDLAGLTARFGPGRPITHSEPAQLLALIGQYIDQRSYSALAALVRHPAIETLFKSRKVKLPENWLSQLDLYYRQVLPKTIDGFINESLKESQVYRDVTQAIDGWLQGLTGRAKPISNWIQPLLAALAAAYDKVPCNLEDPQHEQLYTAAQQLAKAILAWRDIPADLEPRMSASELIAWLLRSLSSQLIAEPPNPAAVEMLGWLELALDDAPVLIIAGLHDGVVPESLSADAFLPNQLRRQLGMVDNARRYARDLYYLQLNLACRKHLRIVVGKTDLAGDPLVPSRLLLACPLERLPSRVLHLVHERSIDVLPAVVRRWQPSTVNQLSVPQPDVVQNKMSSTVAKFGSTEIDHAQFTFKAPSTITVTAFRDYLRCPYRFFLRHILKLRGEQDADVELDASQFGVLVHGALDSFGRSEVSRSTDPAEISQFLVDQLHLIAASQFGPNPPANVLIQIEQAQARLQAFAIKQADRTQQGWVIRLTEVGSTVKDQIRVGHQGELLLIGRIDRIDYHPATGQWAIWDYKTSETAKHPESVHWSKSEGWQDLQLPLYVPIARKLGVTGTPMLGYIGLPKQEREIDFYPANFDAKMLDEAMNVAHDVASKVANCQFWPDPLQAVDFDDYSRICQMEIQKVQVAPPARKLHRSSAVTEQLVPSNVVQAARQRLSNPLVRTLVKLPPLLIRASAGTGKTFQLSNRLLQILLSGQDVDPILATTFTRKAAGEIMQRVLQRLALACIQEGSRQTLASKLPDVDTSADNCLATLRRVTASIHRLRICTLDSFFALVARTFSLDMGLPAGWTAMEPAHAAQMQSQAIAEMLENHQRKRLIDLVRLLAKGETTRRVSDEIRSTVSQGYAIYRRTTMTAWDQLDVPKGPDESAIESALRTVESTKMNDGRIDPQIAKLHLSASIGDWESMIKHGLLSAIKQDPPLYYKKELPGNLIAAIELLQDRAASELLAIRRSQTQACYGLIKAYDQSYTQLIHRARTLAFADVSHFLSTWMHLDSSSQQGQQSLSQLDFRMDCGIRHLLLDEFQDTSLEQWDILQPLASRLGGTPVHDHSFFCVGDTKQAIYGWRGGVAEIFDVVAETVDELKSQELTDSYRSSPPIMTAVNQVFQNLSKHQNYSGCEAWADRWADRFPAHQTALSNSVGLVQLINGPAVEADSAENKKLEFLSFCADRVAALARRSGASIGVLFRTNASVARMIGLLRNRDITASQGSGNPLTDSAAVELILSLIHLADHPGDGICAFHVLQSPMAVAIPEELHQRPWAIAAWVRSMVVRQGLGRTVEWLADRLANYVTWWDQQRLQQLIRCALQFEATGQRLRDFELQVEENPVALPVESQVKVMTIHGSKGLEFDAVFLPELDCELTHSSSLLVTRSQHPCHPPDGVLRYMGSHLQALLTADWQKAFQDNKAGSLSESLCVLYVAMTRAKHALYMITHPAGANPRQDFGSLLQSTLASSPDRSALRLPEQCLFSLGDPDWHLQFTRQSSTPTVSRDQPTENSTDPSVDCSNRTIRLGMHPQLKPTRSMRVVLPSELYKTDTLIELSSAFSISHSLGSTYGDAMHLLLEQIEWLDGAQRFDAEHCRSILYSKLAPDDMRNVDLDRVIADFQSLLLLPNFRKALSRSRYQRPCFGRIPDRIEVHNERAVNVLIDDTKIAGIIDRLVVLYQGDCPYAAEIFDFKVDSLGQQNRSLWLENRKKIHHGQLDMYAQAISVQMDLPRERIAAQLLMISTDDLVSVSPLINE